MNIFPMNGDLDTIHVEVYWKVYLVKIHIESKVYIILKPISAGDIEHHF